tara:strand:- start:83 stop:1531 length:1449 start_codon:yes stop_codon:yes gene_type:complete
VTTKGISALKRLRSATLDLQESTDDGLINFIKWTPPQAEFHAMAAKRKLLRAGNQVGKSVCGLGQVIMSCIGTYEHSQPPPIEAWVVTTSWAQGVALHKKFWELCPKSALTERSRGAFDARRGFGKDNPAVVFNNGSIVRFRTSQQGATALSGSTIDLVHIDEPCDEEIYRELDRRLLRRNGNLIITLTPINKYVGWLKELVDDGIVAEVHARMVPENFVPIGSNRPLCLAGGVPMDQAWIDEQRRTTLKRYAPVLLDGEWETRSASPVFEAFELGVHVTELIPTKDVKVALGIDHGSGRNFKQIGVLVAVDDRGENTKVYVIDEAASDGDTTPDQDADAYLQMLRRNGLQWHDLDHVYGDKEYGGRGDGLGRKSNRELTRALMRKMHMGAGVPLVPSIRQAKTGRGGGRGSVYRGCEWLHRAMLREGHFTCHPRCTRVLASFSHFDFRDSDYKDSIDALRYSVWAWSMRGTRQMGRGMYVY